MSQTPVAVVGVSALFPGSIDARGFWRDILAGRDLTSEVPPTHWLIEDYYDPNPSAPDKTYCKRGAFLRSVDFEPMEFGVPPSIMPATDTAQLLALIVAQKLLEDVGESFSAVDRERVSVILGVTSGQELLGSMVSRLQHPVWLKALRESGIPEAEAKAICERISSHYVPWQEASFPGLLGNVVAGRIANRFDLHGTNCVTDAACASALSALSMAVNELATGQSDLVVTGGVDTMNDILMYMCFSKTPALSPTGDCRPFASAADGTLLGEGIAMLALRRLEDAERDKNRIYAVIRGLGSSSDGRSKSVYAPVPEGQARALRRAYENAGYGPDTVELVEAHGTATKAGDVAEFEGLKQVFGASERSDRAWCALGSVKSQIGHTKAAAGVAGLVKAVLALHHKVLPPTIKVDQPNPKLGIESSPFYLNTRTRPWIRDAGHPRRASVSSFGFGGSNFHVALEEYTGAGQAPRFGARVHELFVFSAASSAALAASCRAQAAATSDQVELAALAHDAQTRFEPGAAARLSLVADSLEDLAAKLKQAIAGLEATPEKAFSTPTGVHYEHGASAGRLAFLFPGQGSQYVGIGADLAIAFDEARAVWDRAAARRFDGTALSQVAFPAPAFGDDGRAVQTARLTATEWAQPAIGVASLASLSVLRALGLRPDCVGGHSFGEVTALHAAGAFDEDTFLDVARKRGELMRDAATLPGGMLAVALPIEEVRELLAQAHAELVIANHNHPTQVVVSGPVEAIERFARELQEKKLNARRLQVATAFHSPLVAGASSHFDAYLRQIACDAPSLPTYSNARAATYASGPEAVRSGLAAQLASPVRFVEQVEAMWNAGVRTFVEVGPGAVLSDFVGRILSGRDHRAIATDRAGRHGVLSLLEAVGRLAVAGHAVDFAPLWRDGTPLISPKRKSQMAIAINGANHGKKYPTPGGQERAPAAPNALPNAAQPAKPPMPDSHALPARPTNGSSAKTYAPAALPERLLPSATEPVRKPADAPTAKVEVALVQAPEAESAAQIRPAAVSADAAWVEAYQETQRSMVAAQSAYQRMMADSHMAFLKAVETSYAALQGWVEQGSAARPAPDVALRPAPDPRPALEQLQPDLQPDSPKVPPAPPATAQPIAPAPQVARASAQDLEALLLAVVSEKTGYPAEMLGMHMELEADLGVDSIKRVEILAAMRERAPGLPEVVASEMAALRTLAEIVKYMRERDAGSAPRPAEASVGATHGPAAAVASAATVDLEPLLLAVVAEKTGYPAEMLGMHMELEADLGVDSIKRVEILSTMRERAPDLPEVVASEMAALRSLGEIVQHMRERAAKTPAAPAPAAAASARVEPRGVDLGALLLAVVAEKTGYPAEMLGMHMELEADLGVDSIKRVEILSTMRERAPDLPEVVASEMAALRTLGQILEYMRERGAGAAGGPARADAAPASIEQPSRTGARPSQRWVVRPVSTPPTGLAMAGLFNLQRLVITDEGSGVAAALKRALEQHGLAAEVVTRVPEDADGVVFLGGLRPVHDVDAALAINHEAFRVAHDIAPRLASQGGVFVCVQDTGGDFGLSGGDPARAWLAGVAALARTAALEWERAAVKCIDLERGGRNVDAVADAIASELRHGGSLRDVGLRQDGTRISLESVPTPASQGALPVDARSVLIVSGGARGVTAAALVALVQASRAKVVLLGRTPLTNEPSACLGIHDDAGLKRALLGQARLTGQSLSPAQLGAQVASILANREVRATLEAVEAAGGRARYAALDVQDRRELDALLEQVRAEWGPITGVIHGAGVLADKLIAEKTPEQFSRVFNTKVAGLRALLEATERDPLSVLAVFSSVAARSGNPGQCDYAMANEVLNAVAAAEYACRAGSCVVKSIGWGPWEGGMVTPSLKVLFEQRKVPLLSLADGSRRFVEELAAAHPEVVTVIGGELGASRVENSGVASEVLVDKQSHPFLLDHRVGGKVVVPVVMAVDWFTRAAQDLRPGLACVEIRDLKVLRGIKLERFEEGSDAYSLHCKPNAELGENWWSAELRGPSGALHYSAKLHVAGPGVPPSASGIIEPGLQPWNKHAIYDGRVLFHGPKFQVIEAIEGISRAGIIGTLSGTRARGWASDDFRTDPALLDGALQLATLWACQTLGGATLPMAVGSYRIHVRGVLGGRVRAIVNGREVHPARAVADIAIVDENGTLCGELLGVENVLRPSEGNAVGMAHAL